MKYLTTLFVGLCCMSLTSCFPGKKAVRKTAAVEKGCPLSKTEVLSKTSTLGRASYRVKACDSIYIYRKIGTTIQEAK